ncbi:GspE/PulE family protein [Cerasicoccus fimbriatus]|uniref:GspE/PulE family protein n=1 Tax=Cerasicoccus fimbriatus TaxID=3014554 RepID=UPI0022B5384C|nr:GspE/PulE family protein [Cerasicoccus sp. TK19100]
MDDVPDSWLERLDEEQQEHFAEAPRQDRVKYLAGIWQEQEADVFQRIASETKTPVLEVIRQSEAPEDALPLRLIHEYQCMPVQLEEHAGELCLVTVWPPSPTMSDWVLAATGREPRWFLGDPSDVAELITQAYGVGSGSLDEQDMEGFADSEQQDDEEDEDAALIRFVNEVISKAIADRATDIHFEPQKETLNIRYRIDGVLVAVRVPENLKTFQRAIISRLKIMAKLNISERRRPQDGRIAFNYGNEELDIRISSLPTMYGESISLRLLSDKTQPVTIEDLGFMPADVKMLDTILQRPHGIILATGPTGAGKSTTLSSFIRRIRDPRRRIVTIEDPVEYEIDGVNQTQVQSEIGLTFASSLRSVLRQDPDVIMVGEIRDGETADIAIRASLTGHLVLSSLHTNDAPGAITRLIDMEIEPFLIASSVEMVIAQRLVRRICGHCAAPADIELHELSSCLMAMHIPASEVTEAHLVKKPVGCERCRGLGFRGRVGLFEILRINDAIHELIIRRASAWEIRKLAESQGMATLQMSGWNQVKRGITSLPEVMRYADVISEEEEKASDEQPGKPVS